MLFVKATAVEKHVVGGVTILFVGCQRCWWGAAIEFATYKINYGTYAIDYGIIEIKNATFNIDYAINNLDFTIYNIADGRSEIEYGKIKLVGAGIDFEVGFVLVMTNKHYYPPIANDQ